MNEPSAEVRAALDNEHLRLLSIGYYVFAGMSLFMAPIGLFYSAMGVLFSKLPPDHHGSQPPEFISWVFGGIGLTIASIGICGAILCFLTARGLRDRQHALLCQITGALLCLQIPFGTVLGIMTFITLNRPSVKAQFTASGGAREML